LILKNHITSSCLINSRAVYLNHEPLLKNSGLNALQFLESIYQEGTYAYPRFYKMDTLSKLGFLARNLPKELTAVKT
jgi:hypothetical protein